MASWHPGTEPRPRPSRGFYRGLLYGLPLVILLWLVCVLLVVAALKFGQWNGAR